MLNEVFEKYRVPAVTGIAFLFAFFVLAALMMFDPVEVGGINRWIKPMKFSMSVGIFLVTIAVYSTLIDGAEIGKKIIGIGTSALLTGEMVLVIMQAARGVRSHFNISTPFDGAVFTAMGVMIFINTLLVVYLLVLLLRQKMRVSPAVARGLQLGVMISLAASLQGAYMSQHFSHAVGVADGGPGLPFLNWSTIGGDLRIAHFVGLHGMQIMPLFALVADRMKLPKPAVVTSLFAMLYFVMFIVTFVQALLGRSLFSVFA